MAHLVILFYIINKVYYNGKDCGYRVISALRYRGGFSSISYLIYVKYSINSLRDLLNWFILLLMVV